MSSACAGCEPLAHDLRVALSEARGYAQELVDLRGELDDRPRPAWLRVDGDSRERLERAVDAERCNGRSARRAGAPSSSNPWRPAVGVLGLTFGNAWHAGWSETPPTPA